MLILTNDEINSLLSMDSCLQLLENAYKDLAEGKAVNRPRTDLYLPSTTDQKVITVLNPWRQGLSSRRLWPLDMASMLRLDQRE